MMKIKKTRTTASKITSETRPPTIGDAMQTAAEYKIQAEVAEEAEVEATVTKEDIEASKARALQDPDFLAGCLCENEDQA